MKSIWLKLSICVFIGAVVTGAVQAQASPILVFSAFPDQNTSELAAKFAGVSEYLSEALEVPVRYAPATNYAASVEMFKNGDVQLAWFGGLTGVQARAAVPGARAIAQGTEDPNYLSYFIAHESAGLSKSEAFPAAIQELGFAFGSPQSTSGRLMPSHFIIENTGQAPEDFFKTRPVFSGSHDKTLELVLNSDAVRAGVINYKVYEKHLAKDPTIAERAPIIWVTPPYADYNFTAHPSLEEMFEAGFTDRLQAALLAMEDPALLAAFPRSGFIAAENADFAQIEAIARDLGFLR